MKKLLAVLLVVVGILFSQLTIVNTNAYADANQCSQSTFMGLRPWYYGISAICDGEQPKDQYEIRRIIWQIVLNVVTMVLQIAGYVCVGYVIWGGYLYMLSNGDPGKVASGKKTIMRALIGIVICVTASSISGAIVDVAETSVDGNFFANIFNHAFMWAGIVCVIMMIIGGIAYVTSAGDPQKVGKAKNTIMYAAIGLIITLVAAAIVNLVLTAVSG